MSGRKIFGKSVFDSEVPKGETTVDIHSGNFNQTFSGESVFVLVMEDVDSANTKSLLYANGAFNPVAIAQGIMTLNTQSERFALDVANALVAMLEQQEKQSGKQVLQ